MGSPFYWTPIRSTAGGPTVGWKTIFSLSNWDGHPQTVRRVFSRPLPCHLLVINDVIDTCIESLLFDLDLVSRATNCIWFVLKYCSGLKMALRGWTKSTWIWFHSDLSLVNPLSLRFGVAFHSSSFPSLYLNDKFTFWNGCAQTTVTEVVLISHDLHVLFSHGEYLNLQSRLALDALVLEGLLHYSGEWSSMGHRIVFFFKLVVKPSG